MESEPRKETKTPRILARQLARPLTDEEIDRVAGGHAHEQRHQLRDRLPHQRLRELGRPPPWWRSARGRHQGEHLRSHVHAASDAPASHEREKRHEHPDLWFPAGHSPPRRAMGTGPGRRRPSGGLHLGPAAVAARVDPDGARRAADGLVPRWHHPRRDRQLPLGLVSPQRSGRCGRPRCSMPTGRSPSANATTTFARCAATWRLTRTGSTTSRRASGHC